MSGREKGAPLTPAEEREQLRQLRRELHEEVQAAREAARELREVQKSVKADGLRSLEDAVGQLSAALQEHVDKQFIVLIEDMDSIEAGIQQHFAEIAGASDSEALLNIVAAQVGEKITGWMLEDDITEKYGELAWRRLKTDLSFIDKVGMEIIRLVDAAEGDHAAMAAMIRKEIRGPKSAAACDVTKPPRVTIQAPLRS